MNGDIVRGLDSVRFLAAVVVAFSHGYGFNFHVFADKNDVGKSLLNSVYWLLAGNLYPGQAAVIVFFIISGFCIHYPYYKGKPFCVLEFLARRYIRIGIPILACLALANYFFEIRALAYVGLWSLICELIYYSAYPLLRTFRRLCGSWIGLCLLLLVVAFVVVKMIDEPIRTNAGTAEDFQAFGFFVTALLGLPIWLLGCFLSEWAVVANRQSVGRSRVWALRTCVCAVAVACSILKFHGDKILGFRLPYYVSLQIFALLALWWLQTEIRYYTFVPPVRALEWGGKWSYSLYIVHPLIAATLASGSNSLLVWPLNLALALVGSYVFYLIVERPSHQVSRFVGNYAVRLCDLMSMSRSHC